MNRPGSFRGRRYVYGGIDIERDRRQADFLAARLIAKLQRNVLRAEGGIS
jgi:hypothetical protein